MSNRRVKGHGPVGDPGFPNSDTGDDLWTAGCVIDREAAVARRFTALLHGKHREPEQTENSGDRQRSFAKRCARSAWLRCAPRMAKACRVLSTGHDADLPGGPSLAMSASQGIAR